MFCLPMKRAIDNQEDVNTTSIAMANYLLLLSRGTNTNFDMPKESNDHHRIFECKTCNRQFTSFQALGGHRASHKRQRINGVNMNLANRLGTELAKPKMHECSICGLEFSVGQALGGHMRRHKAGSDEVGIAKGHKSRRLLWLDLNLTPYENDLKFDCYL